MEQEEDVQRLLEHRVRLVVLLAHVVHLIQEPAIWSELFRALIDGDVSRAGIAQARRGLDEVPALTDAIRHAAKG